MNHLRGYINPQFSQELIMSTEDLWTNIPLAKPIKSVTPIRTKSSKKWKTNGPNEPSILSKSVVTKKSAAEVITEEKLTPRQPKVTKPSDLKSTSKKKSSKVLVVSKKSEPRRMELQQRVRSDAVSNKNKSGKLVPSQVVIP
ncbi:hypothetical protein WA171_004481, partial [Blastocystis sp. BT1]